MVLNSIERLFEDNFDVLRANSGLEALKLLQTHKDIEVIISDQRMPGMTGIEFFEKAKDLAPNSMRILLTGYADLSAVRDAVNSGEVFRYLTKPWSNTLLREMVRVALEAAKISYSEVHALKAQTSVEVKQAGAVLVLDPDPQDGAQLANMLSNEYKVHLAKSLQQAMAILEQDESIWLIMSEARIDGEEVADFLAALKSVHPAMVAMVITSLQDANLVIRLINNGQVLRFLGKPLESTRVLGAVKLAAGRYSLLKNSEGLRARFQVDIPENVRQVVQRIREQPAASAAPKAAAIVDVAAKAQAPRLGVMQQLFSFFRSR
jgi:response regulator RpfG family c-di-GMP phosphodiesterase